MAFPHEIDNFRTVENDDGVIYDEAQTKVVFADDINRITDAVAGIENSLGADLGYVEAMINTIVNNAKRALFPVGSYYMNEINSQNPETLLGFGIWTAVTDRFIIGRSATYTGTGGSTSHTHNLGEAGYALTKATGNVGTTSREISTPNWTATTKVTGTAYGAQSIAANAGTPLGGATNSATTLPPYQAAYIWKRIA